MLLQDPFITTLGFEAFKNEHPESKRLKLIKKITNLDLEGGGEGVLSLGGACLVFFGLFPLRCWEHAT